MLRTFLAVCFLTICAGSSLARSTAVLSGEVSDPTGAVIPRASVSASSTSGQAATVVTNGRGAYEFKQLAPGQYTITAVAAGFAVSQQQFAISAGQVHRLDISLTVEAQQQQVVVRDKPGSLSINPANNANSIVITGRDLQVLSDTPDELRAQLRALTGATAGPNQMRVYTNGFSGASLPPKSAISAIRINEDPFSAAYDQPGFERIEVSTKPGTDRFHGQFSFNVNNSALNSVSPFVSQQPNYQSEMLDGTFGGPINKKASFFIAAERENFNEHSVVNAIVLDPNFNQMQFRQAIANPTTSVNISPQLDYQLTTNNRLIVRYQLTQSNDRNDGIEQLALASQAYSIRGTEQVFQLADTQVLSPNAVNETRFQYVRERNREAAQDLDPTLSVLGAFTGGGNSVGLRVNHADQYELQNAISISRGKHFVELGERLRAARLANTSTANFNGTFTFDSLAAYRITQLGLQQGWTAEQIRAAGGGASQFSITTGRPDIEVTLVDAALYAQDDWRILPHLTFSYGLRFETQTNIHDHADFAPRAALAWGLGKIRDGGSPRTVLRAGFGIFYDRFGPDLLLQSERLNGINQQQIIVASPAFFPGFLPVNTLQNGAALPTVYKIAPNLRAPYIMQSAVTVERELSKSALVSITYLNSRGLRQLLSRNINAPLPGTYNPTDPTSGVRPFGNIGNIYQYESRGIFKQDQLITTFTLGLGSKLSLFGSYTLNYAKSDTAGPSSFPANQYDLSNEYGRAAFDVRHELSIGGTITFPYTLSVSPFVVVTSGRPFNITLGQDLNGDSLFNDRPAFATDLSRPSVVRTRLGVFDTAPISGQVIIPPNYGTGPAQFTVNLRVSKTFVLGRKLNAASNGRDGHRPGEEHSLTFSASAHNLLNRFNVAPPIGELTSPLFGQSNALADGLFGFGAAIRRIDLQVNFAF